MRRLEESFRPRLRLRARNRPVRQRPRHGERPYS
jgi:hypothetical protein